MSSVSSYHAPATLKDALRLLAPGGDGAPSKPLAGGSDLIVQMGAGRHRPSSLIDLKRIPEMTGITRHDGGWRIAAATSCAEMGEHAELRAEWPGVVEAANLIGSKQVQGRATVAGNLCNASPGGDSVPALIAAGAVVEIGSIGADGAVKIRELPVEAVPQGPGRTNLAPGELVLAVRLPKRAAHASDAYLRLIPRTEMDIAVVGCGVSMELDADGCIVTARVSLGAVAPTALLVPEAAAALIGSKLDADALAKAAAAASAACKPIDDKRGTVAYRIQVAGVLARRAATQAYQRALQRNTQETRA